MKTTELGYLDGDRKAAIVKAIEMAQATGRDTEIVICRDIPGEHSGGKDCFCDPKILRIYPEDI